MIEETTYIERKKEGKETLDFESLVNKGIRLLQDLSGKVWTDYNSHDPGVTILEQICYALTELVYLSGFDVKDILTNEDGEIPYPNLALYKPLEIYPSSAITPNDYRKTIVDNVKGIRNIWVYKQEKTENKGLYHFLIDVEKKCEGTEQEIVDNLKKYYNANRNICEDIDKIEVLKREPLDICAIIEINKNQTPEYILAEIFFRCFKVITPRIVFHSYKDISEADLTLDEILSGPQLTNGYIDEKELRPPKQTLFVSELMKEVFLVDGVESINDFHLLKDGVQIRTSLTFENIQTGAYIQLPQSADELKISLEREGRTCTIDMQEASRKLNQLIHRYKSTHNTAQDIEELYTLPKGTHIPRTDFYSIQNHFPGVYGINQYGVPASADTTRKAKARQLKGYLLLFEQVMVNFIAQLQNIPELFSVDYDLKATYFTKLHTSVPNISDLISAKWLAKPETHQADLDETIKKFDNFYERRNRILDYLLAMYGETFSQKTYQQFRYYYAQEELPQIICENKIFLLKYLVKINRYKASSFNYQKPSWNTLNIPSVKLKVSLLLGIRHFPQVTYSDVLANHNLLLIQKEMAPDYDNYLYKRKEWNVELDNSHIRNNFGSISALPEIKDYPKEKIAAIAKEVDYLKDGILCDEFFRYGINLNYYKIGKLNHRDAYTVVFQHPQYNEFIYIGDFNTPTKAEQSINCLQQFLVTLNQQSEGMHIVEHILLRDGGGDKRLDCHLINHKGKTVFKSMGNFSKDHADDFTKELGGLLHAPHNYLIKKRDDDLFELYICKNSVKILKGTEQFLTFDDAELAAEAYNIYFRDIMGQNMLENNIVTVAALAMPDDYFSCRISVVLPSWSARFNNPRFRSYVEETFTLNLPAHIYPELYWLDIQKLNIFEKTYRKWLDSKCSDNPDEADDYAREVILFLLDNPQEKES